MDQRPRRRRSINNDDLKEDGGDGGMQMGGGEGMSPQGGNGQGGRQRSAQPRTQNTQPAAKPTATVSDGINYEAAGTWTYTIDSPQGGGGTIVLTKNGDAFQGSIRRDRAPEPVALENVKVLGNNISFSYPANLGGNSMTVSVNATISKDDMLGTMSFGEMRSVSLKGKRSE